MNFGMLFNAFSGMLLVMWVLPIFPLLYVIVRWRGGPDQPAGVGTHAAMLYFTTVGILLGLAAAANLLYGLISITDVDEELTRISWGLLIGALGFAAINIAMMRSRGPLRDATDVVRVFTGFVMVLAGIVAMATMILLLIELFRETKSERELESSRDMIRAYGSWCFLFLSTYLLSARLLSRNAAEGARGP